MSVAIINYGSGNLRSAAKAFERMGGDETILVTSDAAEVEKADRIVLPGVGAFADCRRGLDAVPGMTDPVLFQSATDFANGTVQFLVQDDAGAVWHFVSDGDDIEERNGGTPVVTGLSGTGPNRAFALTGRP